MSLKTEKLIFFIGSYTEMLAPDFGGSGKGIYVVSLNLISGEICILKTCTLRNPAYLIANNTMLYAITEVEAMNNPKVSAFRIDDDYTLNFLNEQPVKGSLPCHINVINNDLYVACYGSGNLLSFPLNHDGKVSAPSFNFKHLGKSVNKIRQEAPHAHQVVNHPDGKHVFVPDLGIDKVKVYNLINNNLLPLPEKDIDIPEGNGPRHLVFNKKGDIGYLMNELTGKIAVLKIEYDKFSYKTIYDSLPNSFKGTPSGSAIRIHPNGKFLYAANRNIDAITIFEIQDDELQLIDYQYTNGTTLREFNITPDGNWLIACLQDSNEVISYAISETGLLEEKSRTMDIISPVCASFM